MKLNVHAILLLLWSLVASAATIPPLEELLDKIRSTDQARLRIFTGYTGTRNYSIQNTRIHLNATMKVQVAVLPDGSKSFKIIEMTGPGALRKLVFQRMLDTESAASKPEAQSATKINADNYSFRMLETRYTNGSFYHVLAAEPKSANALLFRGNVWIDAKSYAIVRIDGAPAKNPSLWVEKTDFVHEYSPVGEHWLATVNRSETSVRVFGKTLIRIEYKDYKLSPGPVSAP